MMDRKQIVSHKRHPSTLTIKRLRKFGNNDKNDFRVVSGILRLASKYLIDSLRSKALEHLSAGWPSTLKGWDLREKVADESHLDSSQYYPFPVVSS